MSFLSNIIIFVYVYIPALDIWSSEQTKDKITKKRGVLSTSEYTEEKTATV